MTEHQRIQNELRFWRARYFSTRQTLGTVNRRIARVSRYSCENDAVKYCINGLRSDAMRNLNDARHKYKAAMRAAETALKLR